MRVRLFLASCLLSLGAAAPVLACSTFSIPQSPLKIVGNSYDWSQSQGAAMINKRNMEKVAVNFFPDDRPAKWVSKYGSLTFVQYGREFPIAGFNEKGLVVENMWLETSEFPKPDDKPSINELQWVQYVLDGFATVDEVVAQMPAIRISKVYAPVHYLVCDSAGKCATFENIGGKLVVHSGAQMLVNVLTNDTYDDSIAYLRQLKGFGGDKDIPSGSESLQRFARAASLAKAYSPEMEESVVDYAFGILDSVHDEDSKWNIVYQPVEGKVSFRTTTVPAIKTVSLSSFDFSCKTPVKLFDMESATGGDVTAQFVDYTRELDRALIEKGIGPFLPFLPAGTVDRLEGYPEATRCLE